MQMPFFLVVERIFYCSIFIENCSSKVVRMTEKQMERRVNSKNRLRRIVFKANLTHAFYISRDRKK